MGSDWSDLCTNVAVSGSSKVYFSDRPVYQGFYHSLYQGRLGEEKVVVKLAQVSQLQRLGSYAALADQLQRHLSAASKANQLAERFCALESISKHDLGIRIVQPRLFEIEAHSESKLLGAWLTVEHRLIGVYRYFNSNVAANPLPAILQAFSHWTYEHTRGQYLVCGLQGVSSNDWLFELTDVAVHSVDMRYGERDLGVVGVEAFFATHECNRFCRDLGFEQQGLSLVADKLKRPQGRSTLFRFELDQQQIKRSQGAKPDFN